MRIKQFYFEHISVCVHIILLHIFCLAPEYFSLDVCTLCPSCDESDVVSHALRLTWY